jgi:DNA-binding GntR family transcriptional regulator
MLLKIQKELYLKIHLLQVSKYMDAEDSLRKIEHHDTIVKYLIERNTDKVLENVYYHLSKFYDINVKDLRLYRLEEWA